MGCPLPKPVESAVVERVVGKGFRVGVAEINGWRNNMEDAHLIHTAADWGFFGVFDGHGGEACSSFVAERIGKEVKMHGCPKDDKALKKLVLDVDQAFLDSKQDSGSTGTMCIVHRPTRTDGKFQIRIANVGDSRILLGRRDGTMIDGGGTDRGLTTDHKPDHPDERQRIYRCGGFVDSGVTGGPARVNGELSVSRCFGDASHKQTGGPGPEDHPVTANPEFGKFECNESAFLLLVCDGISEGSFPNAEVVRFAASCLKESNDPGMAAKSVCHKAIEMNSKDNVTCMMVLLAGSGSDTVDRSVEFIPGPLSSASNKAFMTAYEGMAKRGGVTLAQAAEMRYSYLEEELSKRSLGLLKAKELRAEADGVGAPPGAPGSGERTAWFRGWAERLPEQYSTDDSEEDVISMLLGRTGGAAAGAGGGPAWSQQDAGRRVRVVEGALLKKCVSEHPSLSWDARMASLPGAMGVVKMDDASDGTSQINFPDHSLTAWLPKAAFVDCDPGAEPAAGRSVGITPALRFSAGSSAPARREQPLPGARAEQQPVAKPPRPDAAGPRSSSPASSSSFKDGGARIVSAPRLPAVPGMGRTRTPSPGVTAAGRRTAGYRSSSPVDASIGRGSRAGSPSAGLS